MVCLVTRYSTPCLAHDYVTMRPHVVSSPTGMQYKRTIVTATLKITAVRISKNALSLCRLHF